jgi:thiol-disulfide isomerase/thioredoxin
MRKYIALIFVLQGFGTDAQTFVHCADSYHREFNKVKLEFIAKKIDRAALYMAMFKLEESLDTCIIGKEMPEYNFVGRSGKSYTNESLKGKVVVFNFWSVNCGPCIGEIPVLNRIHLSFKQNEDFVLISILLDDEESLERFLEGGITKRRIVYEVVPDSKSIMKSTFKLVKAFPTNLFVNREGKIFMKTSGGIIDPKKEQKLEMKFRSIIDSEMNKEGSRL